MKKSLMILLGVALILSMMGGVTGEDLRPNGVDMSSTGSTLVVYDVDETYLVSIPSEISIPKIMYIDASDYRLDDGHSLNIYMESKNDWKLHLDPLVGDENPLVNATYQGALLTMSMGHKLLTSDAADGEYIVYSVDSGDVRLANELHLQLSESVEVSGRYTDTLTFTVRIEDTGDFQSALNKLSLLPNALNDDKLPYPSA